jgi:UDP-N-acetylmuramoylalanine--D-glutamate ligase
LLGGQAKGQEFGGLRPVVNQYVKYLITYGEAAHELAQVGFSCPVDQVESLEQAFALAQSQATSGDRVVLSPACASLDQFQDYRQRGNRFKQLVIDTTGGAR